MMLTTPEEAYTCALPFSDLHAFCSLLLAACFWVCFLSSYFGYASLMMHWTSTTTSCTFSVLFDLLALLLSWAAFT